MSLARTLGRLAALPPLMAAAVVALTDSMFWPGVVYLTLSLPTLLLYGWDKRQSMRHGRRIPEKWLHLCELAGGWPGALIGQQWLHHKCSKAAYQWRYWLIVLIHWALWAGYFGWRWHLAHPIPAA